MRLPKSFSAAASHLAGEIFLHHALVECAGLFPPLLQRHQTGTICR
jgi:hypothetical protein